MSCYFFLLLLLHLGNLGLQQLLLVVLLYPGFDLLRLVEVRVVEDVVAVEGLDASRHCAAQMVLNFEKVFLGFIGASDIVGHEV